MARHHRELNHKAPSLFPTTSDHPISVSSASYCFFSINAGFLRAQIVPTSCSFFLHPPLKGLLLISIHSHSPSLSSPTWIPAQLPPWAPQPSLHTLPHQGRRDLIVHLPGSYTLHSSPLPLGNISSSSAWHSRSLKKLCLRLAPMCTPHSSRYNLLCEQLKFLSSLTPWCLWPCLNLCLKHTFLASALLCKLCRAWDSLNLPGPTDRSYEAESSCFCVPKGSSERSCNSLTSGYPGH